MKKVLFGAVIIALIFAGIGGFSLGYQSGKENVLEGIKTMDRANTEFFKTASREDIIHHYSLIDTRLLLISMEDSYTELAKATSKLAQPVSLSDKFDLLTGMKESEIRKREEYENLSLGERIKITLEEARKYQEEEKQLE